MFTWKIKLCCAGLLLVLWTNANPPSKSYASNTPITSSSTIEAFIVSQSKLYGVDPKMALFIADHESRFKENTIGDDGQSRGLFQISKMWHPEVSSKCAFDYKCATVWSIKRIKAGYAKEWSTWRFRCKLYGVCKPI